MKGTDEIRAQATFEVEGKDLEDLEAQALLTLVRLAPGRQATITDIAIAEADPTGANAAAGVAWVGTVTAWIEVDLEGAAEGEAGG